MHTYVPIKVIVTQCKQTIMIAINFIGVIGIAPVITFHPLQDIQIQPGHKVTLEVMAFSTKPLQFQWYYEDNIIDGMLSQIVFMPITSCYTYIYVGENKSFYSICPVTISSAGRYYCQVKNQCGEVYSTTTNLTVTMTPTAQHSSKISGFTYTPNIDKGLAVLQTQGVTPSADLRS